MRVMSKGRYTYRCRFCDREEIVYPMLDLGDGYHLLHGWDTVAMKCPECLNADAVAAAAPAAISRDDNVAEAHKE